MDVVAVRPLNRDDSAELELVAERMRATLVEVLGRERALELYTLEQLRERVRWHLAERRAEVFVSCDAGGAICGHTIVRVEDEDGLEVGLFSTTYVEPVSRRAGVAQALLDRGEQWLRGQGMTQAVTYTDAENHKLIELFGRRGYAAVRTGEWVRLARELGAPLG